MLKETFQRGVEFTRRNPTIFYSLFLIVAITGALFFSSYYSLQKFQATSDALLKSKAILAENTFRILGADLLNDTALLQKKIDRAKEENDDVTAIVIFTRETDEAPFHIAASTDHASIGEVVGEKTLPYLIAWQDERVVPTFLTNENNTRYWNVVRKITDRDGRGLGLILFQLSLKEHDAFIQKAIFQAYGVTIISLFFVLLLLGNHMRFFRYALRVTKLEEVDHMKDDFISMASHELKTPLTVLRGYVDLLGDITAKENTDQTKKETKEYLSSMDASLVRLNDLVGDILDVSRLEQNRLPIVLQALDMTDILESAAKEFSVMAKSKGLEFHYEPVTMPMVSADSDRVKQIIVNLLGNAVKYTPHGTVELSAKETDDEVVITVADTGLGISAEAMEHLFSKFYRVKTDKTAQISGTGLGLWISREIARKIGGDLTVESIEGVGSHFHLHLKKQK